MEILKRNLEILRRESLSKSEDSEKKKIRTKIQSLKNSSSKSEMKLVSRQAQKRKYEAFYIFLKRTYLCLPK